MLRDLITYGSPRVGDAAFSASLLQDRTRQTPFKQSSYRIVDKFDIVASVPGRDWNDPSHPYQHVKQGLRAGIEPGEFELIPEDTPNPGDKPEEGKDSLLDKLSNLWPAFFSNDGT
jgi:hypothetical protein